jgi:hypothetical protein
MSSNRQPSFGQRIYRALFKIFGPADVGPSGPPTVTNPDDATVPTGYHLETITDGSGVRRRIAVQNSPNQNKPAEPAQSEQDDHNPPS